uniref:Uncharacterized protein n=2 Tax=Cucumis sativus TaxID=3659 RepID=A0A0A0L386_CUCSA
MILITWHGKSPQVINRKSTSKDMAIFAPTQKLIKSPPFIFTSLNNGVFGVFVSQKRPSPATASPPPHAAVRRRPSYLKQSHRLHRISLPLTLSPLPEIANKLSRDNWCEEAYSSFLSIEESFEIVPNSGKDMGGRGVIGDKWSTRVLWVCALGSVIGMYMVAQERQLQNRQRMLTESLKDVESGGNVENV